MIASNAIRSQVISKNEDGREDLKDSRRQGKTHNSCVAV
jgi:hypothetical protein